MTLQEIVEKLIGQIRPVGESNTDDQRFENLKEMCSLVDGLLYNINQVAKDSHSYEHSVKRAAYYAKDFIEQIKSNQ